MPRYRNGEIPRDALLLLASGTNKDGYWEHLAPPGTARKIAALVHIGRERHGRILQITAGWNVYRPMDPQRLAYRNSPPGNAAFPGTSSHGGTYAGMDTMAIDFANWEYVFGSYAAFAAACREVGLVPGVFSWEPWHVFDYDPWAAAPSSTPSSPVEDDMYDTAARAELLWELECLRPIKMYALVDATGAGGWVWVGPSGRWWIVPSGAYAVLVSAQKLSQSRPIRGMPQDEFNFMTKQLMGGLVPDSKTDYDAEAQLDKILTLDQATVERIASSIAAQPITVSLTRAQLDEITAAAQRGGREAIEGLSFVVTAG